ncbi:hypothetical protein CKALI_08630 [Corynebacterium kalinowskii]|uniref:ApeA N-terminal domain-containing protein n=1 Tax=Corynebacterium kalinowskii TaxID=2675216 RepID=A0A6B8VUG2_9CORY|nr:hypothetical protein [Corynebacterium kalinowskii]QGU02585.1 hypothetical protein CKALI_08630 [Corynebacterium kalinowskii]
MELKTKNVLTSERDRQGWIIADDQAPISAALSRQEDRCVISLVSDYVEPENRWTDSVNPRDAWSHPFDFLFIDELGQVEVANCWTIQVRGAGPFQGVERWELQPQHLIFDGNGKTWENASEVVSYVPMLRHWMREDAELIDSNYGDDNNWLEINLKKSKSILFRGQLKHEIILEARTESIGLGKGIQAFSIARIITKLDKSEERDIAIEEHTAVLEFLSIIYGQPIGFTQRSVSSSCNPILNFNHQPINPDYWRECRVESLGNEDALLDVEEGRDPEALIRYSTENPEVFSRWLEFWANNKPGVDALKRALSEKISWENRLLNVAVAVEEFGHRIPGQSERGTLAENFPVYLKRVCLSMPRIVMMHPELWANRFNAAYKGIKHADNDYPELAEIVRTADQGINWLRAWCCFQIDPDNPIMDYTWSRINNIEEFYPKSQEDLANDNWASLLTDEEWKQESARLTKANSNYRWNRADVFNFGEQNSDSEGEHGG